MSRFLQRSGWVVFLAAALFTTDATADTIRVPADHPTIQDAIDAAVHGDVVLVADGTYQGPGNRDVDFSGKDIVVRSENGPAHCIVDAQGTPAVPYRAFLFTSGESRKARLEGFTITGGDTLPGAIADQFNGGGVFISGASPTIKNCVFTGNSCGCWGAAVYATTAGRPLITNCLFDGNNSGDDGGGLFSWLGAHPVVRNSVFINNTAPANGGAIAVFGGGGGVTIENVTMVNNFAGWGSAISDFGVNSTMVNTIVWGNTGGAQIAANSISIAYSNIEGGYDGPGNFDANPGLAADGYHLTAGSPCVDRGVPGFVPGEAARDIDGEPRLGGLRCDVGADELQRHRPGHGTSGL